MKRGDRVVVADREGALDGAEVFVVSVPGDYKRLRLDGRTHVDKRITMPEGWIQGGYVYDGEFYYEYFRIEAVEPTNNENED